MFRYTGGAFCKKAISYVRFVQSRWVRDGAYTFLEICSTTRMIQYMKWKNCRTTERHHVNMLRSTVRLEGSLPLFTKSATLEIMLALFGEAGTIIENRRSFTCRSWRTNAELSDRQWYNVKVNTTPMEYTPP